jgi:uncharacterized protein
MKEEFQLRPFRAPWWAPGGHLQTLAGKVLRGLERRELRRRRIELSDGDFVDLHEEPQPFPAGTPIVVILHGLEGFYRSNYVTTIAAALAKKRIRPIRLNFRGCSGEMNRLARFYHAGDTADLDEVLRLLREENPGVPMGAIGFSLGGNVLVKYLGECEGGGPAGLCCAAAVSVPFDLNLGTAQLETGITGRFYTGYFLRKLRSKVVQKRNLLDEHLEVERALATRTIRDFDDLTTARLHGFRDVHQYYELSSSGPWLPKIRIPTLLLQALDDPFQPTPAPPAEVLQENPLLVDGFSRRGGHVGFVQGTPWQPVFWAEQEAARFLEIGLRRHRLRFTRATAVADDT